MEILKNPNFDFLGKTRYFVAASLLLILAGVAYIATATALQLRRRVLGRHPAHREVPERARRSTASATRWTQAAPGAVIQTYDDAAKNQVLIRLARAPARASSTPPRRPRAGRPGRALRREPRGGVLLRDRGPGGGRRAAAQGRSSSPCWACSSSSSTSRSASRARSGARRPPWPCFHDVLVTLAFLAFFRYEITLNVIAALLTLVGYSVNDTIVIFDRARENLRHKRKDPLRKILNDSAQPDPDPHPHLERHHLPGRARPVPVRGRGAARLRLHHGGRASWSGPTPRSTSRARSWSGGASSRASGGRRRPQARRSRRRSVARGLLDTRRRGLAGRWIRAVEDTGTAWTPERTARV